MKAFSFEIDKDEDIWYLFCTPMSSVGDSVIVDIWCPENPIFTRRKSFLQNNLLIEAVQNYIFCIARQNGINTSHLIITRK